MTDVCPLESKWSFDTLCIYTGIVTRPQLCVRFSPQMTRVLSSGNWVIFNLKAVRIQGIKYWRLVDQIMNCCFVTTNDNFWVFFVFFFFHPSSGILETILWVDGFPIVSVLGSSCLGVGLCQLLPSMRSNVIISSYFLLHSPTLTRGCQIWPRLGSNPGTAALQSGTLSIELPHPPNDI